MHFGQMKLVHTELLVVRNRRNGEGHFAGAMHLEDDYQCNKVSGDNGNCILIYS